MIALIIIVVLIVLFIGFVVSAYNRLIRLKTNAEGAFSQIDVQLERRHDLIPNLVETAKGFMAHEKDTLEAVIAARASATQMRIEVNGDPSNIEAMQRMAQSEGNLGGALGRLLATAEAYPDLKSNQQMNALMEELTTTENKISFARQNFNDQVQNYSEGRQVFPSNIVANSFGGSFPDIAYLDLDEDGNAHKRENVQVSFDDPPAEGSA